MAGNSYRTPNKPFRRGKKVTKLLATKRPKPALGGKLRKKALKGA